MPKENEEQVDPSAIIEGLAVVLVILVLIMLAILLPGLYLKLWEWVY